MTYCKAVVFIAAFFIGGLAIVRRGSLHAAAEKTPAIAIYTLPSKRPK
jgi:hypothetical protein